MRYMTLTPRMQVLALVGGVALSGWLAFATVSVVVQDLMMRSKDDAVRDAKLAYIELLEEVTEYYGQYAAITRNLEANQEYLLSVMAERPETAAELDAIRDRLHSSETEMARVAVAQDSLRGKLDTYQDELTSVADSEGSLEATLTALRGMLRNSDPESATLASAREHVGERLRDVETQLGSATREIGSLERTIAALRDLLRSSETERERLADTLDDTSTELASRVERLGDAESEGETLRTTIADLETRLHDTEAERREIMGEKSELQRQLARLETDLETASSREGELNAQIVELTASLDRTIDERNRLSSDSGRLHEQVNLLSAELDTMEDTQEAVMRRLGERTRMTIDMAEATIAMTGLDVDELMTRLRTESAGEGGPFVPAVEAPTLDDMLELPSTAVLLDRQLDRWDALREVLSSLPVVAPVDQFNITSRFGVRSDPINGQAARHYGLDLAAWYNTPVYAPGPGKVVFAGWRGRYGRLIEIDHGMGIRTRYGHLKKILVKVGDKVDHRQLIARVGSSGRSTGPHVHWEVRLDGKPIDPEPFLRAGKQIFAGLGQQYRVGSDVP